MSSIQIDGIRFVVYSNDHPPRRIHGFLSETEVIVDLLEDRNVTLATRKDAIRPATAKRFDVRRILDSADENFLQLATLWETVHGNA